MRRPALLLLCALIAALATRSALADGQRVEDGKAVVDEDYRFRLALPAPGWRLLDEQGVGELVPDAVAGAVAPGGVFGVVIVESAPGLDLDALADTIVEGMPLEQKQVERTERLIYRGRPARRISITGRIDDVAVRYRLTLFENQGFAYQLIAWSVDLERRRQTEGFAALEDAFTLLEGAPKGRSTTRTQRDMTGVGWRIRDGVFESAAYGMRIRPQAPWSLVVGDDLRQMNDDAEIGLQCANPEVYVVFIPELYAGADREDFAAALRRTTAGNIGATKILETRSVGVLGAPVPFHGFDADPGMPLRFWHGVRFEGDVCHQVLGWYPRGHEQEAWPRLEALLESVERLSAAEVKALDTELAREFAARTRVGPDHCLRGGRYIDFTYDFVFTRPVDGYWRLSTGQEARNVNADSLLVLEEPRAGLFGYVIAEDDQGLEPEAYHDLVVSMIWGEDSPVAAAEPEIVTIGGRQGRRQAALLDIDGRDFWFDVVTLLHRGRAFQIVASGLAGNRKHVEPAAAAMRAAFAFPAGGLEAVERTATGHADHRLGFAVDLRGAPFALRDATPAALRGVGSLLFGGRDEHMVGYLAVCAMREGQDESFIQDLVRQMLTSVAKDLTDVEPQRVEQTFRGRPATRMLWSMPNQHAEILIVQRDRTMYLVIEVTPAGAKPAARSPADRLTFLD